MHVESGSSSATSSVYGGSAAPTPGTAGSAGDLASSVKPEALPGATGSPPLARSNSLVQPSGMQASPGHQPITLPDEQKRTLSPSLGGGFAPQYEQQQYPGTAPPPQQGQNLSPQLQQNYAQQPMYPAQPQGEGGGGALPGPAANLNDPGFRNFFGMVGSNFAVEKVWHAYQRSGGDLNRGLQILLEAKPLVHPPGHPETQAPSQQQQHEQQTYSPAGQYAQLNSPHLSAPGTPGSSHHPMLPGRGRMSPQYQDYMRNPAQFANMQHLQQQQQQQQSRAQIQTMMRTVQNPQGYPQMMNGQQQHQMTAQQQQQQQQIAFARSIAAGGQNPNFAGAPGPVYPPIPRQPQSFPIAAIGYAGFTDAHYNHYLELQRSYFSGKITEEDNKALSQYATVLKRHAMQGNHPPVTQVHQGQGGYAGAGQQLGQSQPQVPFKRGPGRPPKNAQYIPKHQAPQTSGSILARQLAAASAAGSATKKKLPKKKAYGSDSDDDGGDYDSAGSGDEYGSRENPAAVARREQLAVEFFNTCEKELLMELAGEYSFRRLCWFRHRESRRSRHDRSSAQDATRVKRPSR